MKCDPNGTRMWTQQMGTTLDDIATAVAVDRGGNVFVTGYTQGSLDGNINKGGEDAFVVKYDTGGTKWWTRQMGSSMNDEAFGVAVDNSGSVYIVGDTSGDFEGNVKVGQADAFVVKLSGK